MNPQGRRLHPSTKLLMKKIILAPLFLLILASCDSGGVRGNGHLASEQRTLSPFSNVDTEGAFQVDWRAGAPSATVTTDENLIGLVELRVTGDTLHVGTQRSVRPTHSIKLALTSAALKGADLSGASQLVAHQLTGPRFAFETAGAAKVTLDGTVDELVVSMTGAGDLRADSLQTKSAELSLIGAGDARVAVSDTLKVSIIGAGKVEYTGNPPHIQRNITGAGTVRKRD